jgi:hypothetical protein
VHGSHESCTGRLGCRCPDHTSTAIIGKPAPFANTLLGRFSDFEAADMLAEAAPLPPAPPTAIHADLEYARKQWERWQCAAGAHLERAEKAEAALVNYAKDQRAAWARYMTLARLTGGNPATESELAELRGDVMALWQRLGDMLSLIDPKQMMSAPDQAKLANARAVHAIWSETPAQPPAPKERNTK